MFYLRNDCLRWRSTRGGRRRHFANDQGSFAHEEKNPQALGSRMPDDHAFRVCAVICAGSMRSNAQCALYPEAWGNALSIVTLATTVCSLSHHAFFKFIVVSQTSVRYCCLAVHFNAGVQGRETENGKVEIHVENARSCCKFRVQAVRGETVQPFES